RERVTGRNRHGAERAPGAVAIPHRDPHAADLPCQLPAFGDHWLYTPAQQGHCRAQRLAHEAGIHQHGVIANPLCYEIMTPESVGVPGNKLVLGKHSGRHALGKRLAELGYTASGDELDSVYARFMKLAESKKKIYDQDLLSLVPMSARERATA